MTSLTLIYYGISGLTLEVLGGYFHNLGLDFERAHTVPELLNRTQTAPRPVVILASNEPPPALITLARQLILDPARAFPHVFILYDGDPFDAQLESITVITGKSKLRGLAQHIHFLLRARLNGS